jgi:hypothetical protein
MMNLYPEKATNSRNEGLPTLKKKHSIFSIIASSIQIESDLEYVHIRRSGSNLDP